MNDLQQCSNTELHISGALSPVLQLPQQTKLVVLTLNMLMLFFLRVPMEFNSQTRPITHTRVIAYSKSVALRKSFMAHLRLLVISYFICYIEELLLPINAKVCKYMQISW